MVKTQSRKEKNEIAVQKILSGQLPDNVEDCHQLLVELSELLLQKDALILENAAAFERMKIHFQNLLRGKYGRSTEKVDPNQLSVLLEHLSGFDEASSPESEESSQKNDPKKRKHGGGGRNPLSPDLQQWESFDHFPEETICNCGCTMTEFAVEITEQLDYRPVNFGKIKHVVHKFRCAECRSIREGRKPEQVHSGGVPAEGLLAHLVVSLHADHQPIERQAKTYARQGVELAVSSLGRWVALTAQKLKCITDRMSELVLKSRILEADESPLDFIDLSRPAQKIKQGYFWAYYGDESVPFIVFDFQTSRESIHCVRFLEGFKGFLLTDGYGGYEWYDSEKSLCCHVHARRYFEKALKANKKEAAYALALYRKLYEIEDRIKDAPEAERYAIRQRESLPLLNQLHAWLKEKQPTAPPKTPLGIAINYSLSRWDKLVRYTEHGFLLMDTNLIENAFRAHAITRKNIMFAGSEIGGKNNAILATIVNTCKRMNINPFDYIRDCLIRLGANPLMDVNELIPGRWKPLAQPP